MTKGFENRIFAFWTGDNPMSDNRKRCLETFPVTGLEPVLVTPENLGDWIVPEHRLHPAYEYLSPVHRSDYLRAYFMHHHGGGYADIKRQTGSWMPTVERVLSSRRLVGAGYREIRGGTVWIHRHAIGGRVYVHSLPLGTLAAWFISALMRGLWPLMIGNGAFYFKPNTIFTGLWLKEVERRLDLLQPALREQPGRHPRDKQEEGNGYPVPWAFLLGAILGPMSLASFPCLARTLPRPDLATYQ